jgi:serine/threonine protein kinase
MIIYNDFTIKLSSKKNNNIITIQGRDYQLKHINDDNIVGKGGNSNVFTLYDLQNENDNLAIKICKANLLKKYNPRVQRFIREIAALRRAKLRGLNKVVEIISYGKINVTDELNKNRFKFYYHITEKAQCDLADYVKQGNLEENIQSKISLCWDLIVSLSQLHSINVYHRDIKPENILMFRDGSWKFCDLGLVEFRDLEMSMDKQNDMIGPRGWLSPEACNKYYNYCERSNNKYLCEIDQQSDLFQLGKIFWFIFQRNIPIGRVKRQDFSIMDDRIYSIIVWMLAHNKTRRLSIDRIQSEFYNNLKNAYVF